MVNVTVDHVRKRVGLTSTDISDEDVLAFINEASAFLGDEIGRTLDPNNCSEAEANAIRNLAAIYSYVQATGGVATGLNFSVGNLRVDEKLPDKVTQLNFLKEQIESFIQRELRKKKTFAPVLGEYEG
jgi:hypothetical protein